MTPRAEVTADEVAAFVGELLGGIERGSRRERRRGRRVAALSGNPDDLEFALALTDGVGRIADPKRALGRLGELLDEHPSPGFLGPVDRRLLRGALAGASVAPGVVAHLVRRRIRHEASTVVLPARDRSLTRHLAHRRRQGIGVNVNVLGEAILGDEEAQRRARQILGLVARRDVDYVSLKVSALVPRLNALAFESSLERVVDALRPIYRAAAAKDPPVFVNLDMEEYRDLELTVAAFEALTGEPELRGVDAGVVLQAYLPDSHAALVELGAHAAGRRLDGGGRTRIRVVKGANLNMERVEAEQHGWTPAPYGSKAEVDASYKGLVEAVLDPRHAESLRLGLASHNLFDLAWGILLAERLGASARVEVEMLEGMAPGQPEAFAARGVPVRLYSPVVRDEEFDAAAAYLVRRLDENSAPENYLRHHFELAPASSAFDVELARFTTALERRDLLSHRPRRAQDRAVPTVPVAPPGELDEPFRNAPDTDWAKAANRRWIAAALRHDPRGRVPAARVLPDVASVDRAVARARAARPGWSARGARARAELLIEVAHRLEIHRAELVSVLVHEAAKIVTEADVEVSEAVDFAAYDARLALALDAFEARPAPLGTVVVVPPWNFPLSIALGGVLGALAAGNTVVLKPAPETVLTGWLAASCLWEAGVPRDVLQFLPCPDGAVGRHLVTHPDVDAVVLTGSYDTAAAFVDWKPDMTLLAETSGKNALVVTAAADLDLAVADLVRSAFGHAGQKCSAASLALVEESVLADGRFLRKLADATRTMAVGPAADPVTEVGPLVGPAEGKLLRALTRLDAGERWLVRPQQLGPRLWSPGVRGGVRPDSWFARTECFGPVLGVIAVRDLAHGVEVQNASDYGLCAGLHSLDPAEARRWAGAVEAGNLYVNRPITGAVVDRQPFGGWKRSSLGTGAQAGGPGALLPLCRWSDATDDSTARLGAARRSYPAAWAQLDADEHLGSLVSEENLLRHRPLPCVVLRVGHGADRADEELCRLAAQSAGVELRVSRVAEESEGALAAALAERAGSRPGARLRVLGAVGEELLRAAHGAGVDVDRRAPVADGRVELRRWAREQALSVTTHRYGRLVASPVSPR